MTIRLADQEIEEPVEIHRMLWSTNSMKVHKSIEAQNSSNSWVKNQMHLAHKIALKNLKHQDTERQEEPASQICSRQSFPKRKKATIFQRKLLPSYIKPREKREMDGDQAS